MSDAITRELAIKWLAEQAHMIDPTESFESHSVTYELMDNEN